MGKENDFKIKKLNTILTEEGSLEFFNAKASQFQCLNKDVRLTTQNLIWDAPLQINSRMNGNDFMRCRSS